MVNITGRRQKLFVNLTRKNIMGFLNHNFFPTHFLMVEVMQSRRLFFMLQLDKFLQAAN